MIEYIVRRLLILIPVLLGVLTLVFIIVRLVPGDPIQAILGNISDKETIEALTHELNLDKPILEQYFLWLSGILQGDFGRSFISRRPVLDELFVPLQTTLILTFTAMSLAIIMGVVLIMIP